MSHKETLLATARKRKWIYGKHVLIKTLHCYVNGNKKCFFYLFVKRSETSLDGFQFEYVLMKINENHTYLNQDQKTIGPYNHNTHCRYSALSILKSQQCSCKQLVVIEIAYRDFLFSSFSEVKSHRSLNLVKTPSCFCSVPYDISQSNEVWRGQLPLEFIYHYLPFSQSI